MNDSVFKSSFIESGGLNNQYLNVKRNELAEKFHQLQTAYSQPRIYTANFFAGLINTVDISAEMFLADQIDRMNEISEQARIDQSKIVETIKEHQKNLLGNEFENDLELLDKIRGLGAQLLSDDVLEIGLQIQETLLLVQKRIFMNKGLWFWDNLGLDSCKRQENESSSIKPFGILIVLEDEFMLDKSNPDNLEYRWLIFAYYASAISF